jgi:hypothetical protein
MAKHVSTNNVDNLSGENYDRMQWNMKVGRRRQTF